MSADQASQEERDLYVGFLITREHISVVVSKSEKTSAGNDGHNFVPFDDGKYDRKVELKIGPSSELILRFLLHFIRPILERVRSIGVGSYGPLTSVGLFSREDDYFHILNETDVVSKHVYGKVSHQTPHKSIANLPIYQIIRQELVYFGSEFDSLGVAIQTDVICGALCEANKRKFKFGRNNGGTVRLDKDVIVFLNLSDGIGGGFVGNKQVWQAAHHPEMGHIVPQINPDDSKAIAIRESDTKRASFIYIEKLVSLDALLNDEDGNRVKEIVDLVADDWKFAVEYIAQLCAAITFIIAPHQIVLNGPISRLSKVVDGTTKDFVDLVAEEIHHWTSKGGEHYVVFSEREGDDRYIDRSSVIQWPTSGNPDGSISPMLYGALIYGTETPAENEGTRDI